MTLKKQGNYFPVVFLPTFGLSGSNKRNELSC